ncbi:MAG: hypothetical protein JSU07_01475 [Bacteroidetes bacterium]|nr:hypothetical protein [Bacteroidota bacterium]
MINLLISLIITWTDIFEGIGHFFLWMFKGVRFLGQFPNVLISTFIIGLLAYWTLRLSRYKKEAQRNGTIE